MSCAPDFEKSINNTLWGKVWAKARILASSKVMVNKNKCST